MLKAPIIDMFPITDICNFNLITYISVWGSPMISNMAPIIQLLIPAKFEILDDPKCLFYQSYKGQ